MPKKKTKKNLLGIREPNRTREFDKHHIFSDNMSWSGQEAYKVLRTNIMFSLPGQDKKIIAVTSASSGDGKSTTAINVAVAFGQLENKKVLMIDCDMRKPAINSLLRISAKEGLSDVLAGLAKVDNVIQHREEYGIDILPSGHIPPDATLLLQSTMMETLLTGLKDKYDYIIIDLPPVTAVTDAILLSPLVDGYLMVTRHMQTDLRVLRDAIEQLRFADANVLGFIYNDYSPEATSYGYKKYTHGGKYAYRYGYGYGYYKQDSKH